MKPLVLAGFVALLVVTGWLYRTVPSAFLPEEDQGYFITIVQAPEGVSLNYTSDVMGRVEQEIAEPRGGAGHLCRGRLWFRQ
jgi:HAE1 family hydrophobic/amphiphilic exporter-1